MTLEEHCQQSISFFGESFEAVHRWSDEFSRKTAFLHRRLRYHEEGIHQVSEMYGE